MAITQAEYLRGVRRTYPALSGDMMLVNMALGLCGETVELRDQLEKSWQVARRLGNTLDPLAVLAREREEVISEFGDCLWYLFASADTLMSGHGEVPDLVDNAEWLGGSKLGVGMPLDFCDATIRVTCRYAESVKKLVFHNKPLDRASVMGVLSLYARCVAGLYAEYEPGGSLSAVAESNLRKLQERYPAGFKTS